MESISIWKNYKKQNLKKIYQKLKIFLTSKLWYSSPWVSVINHNFFVLLNLEEYIHSTHFSLLFTCVLMFLLASLS